MRCDICGAEEQLFKTEIEEAEMAVCQSCSEYGNVVSKITKEPKSTGKTNEEKEQKSERKRQIKLIKSGYPDLIKDKRESKGLKQEEMAHQIGEKESVIHKLETGSMEPDMDLARRLEDFLGIELVEEYRGESETPQGSESPEMTVGDMVTIN